MRIGLATLFIAALGATVTLATGIAGAGQTGCGSGENGSTGYSYAGRQATVTGHGVRARITTLRAPTVGAGHVAGWVGVGGPRQGANGEDAWIQVGIAGLPNTAPMLYAEIMEPGHDRVFIPIEEGLLDGATRNVAVLEMAKAPNHWRVWVGGKPVTKPIHLPGSSGRWEPIATAESWNGGAATCNGFAFRFENVGVAGARGGSWHAFRPGYTFLDRGYELHALTPEPGAERTLSTRGPRPYAFDALSTA